MTWADDAKRANVIERVDTFIRHFQDLDFISHPIHDADRQLSHDLSRYISDYLALPSQSPFKEGLASLCESWINKAIASGVIKEGEGVLRQLRHTSEQREKLIQENERLKAEIARLKAALDAPGTPLISPNTKP